MPVAHLRQLTDDEGRLSAPGTLVTVQVSDQTEPRNLQRSFPSPQHAVTVLEAQTAIGIVPTVGSTAVSVFDANLEYRAPDNALTRKTLTTAYRYPHLGLKKGAKVFDVGAYLASNPATSVPPPSHQEA